jgi:hypothetical protein
MAAISLYKKYHIEKNDERFGMFLLLAKKFNIESALYPGCFVHITPSFVFPKVVYIDINKQETSSMISQFVNLSPKRSCMMRIQ